MSIRERAASADIAQKELWSLDEEERVKALKNIAVNLQEKKGLIILVDSIQMLSKYIKTIPKIATDKIQKTKDPTTIIYQNPIISSIILN